MLESDILKELHDKTLLTIDRTQLIIILNK